MINFFMSTDSMTWIRWVAPLALLGMIGCGSDPGEAITLVPVTGTITINGKPMANAMVSFIPDAGNKASTAGGDTTGPDGNYMAQYRGRNGLAPGKYKVTVVPGAAEESSNAVAGLDPFMASEGARAAAATKPAKKKEIKGEFEGDVEETATTLDFDVKASASTK
jgi:hypothetical protein